MKKIILMCLVALFSVGIANAQEPKKGDKKKSVTVEFVTDIDCAGCAKKVTNTIPYEKGVKDVKVDVATKTVAVTYDATKNTPEGLLPAFKDLKVKVFKHMSQEEFAKHKAHGHNHTCTDCTGHNHNHNHAGHKH